MLHQTYQNFEVIILDDRSSDESRTVIEEYRSDPKVKHVIFNDQNSGSAFKQWSLGLTHATGDWIWIAESDDYCDNDFLAKLLEGPRLDVCALHYCSSIPVDENESVIREFQYDIVKEGVYDGESFLDTYLLQSNAIPNASAVVVKTDVLRIALKEVGPQLRTFRLLGDWLVWISVSLLTKISYSKQTRNYHRWHRNTARAASFDRDFYLDEQRRFRKAVERILLASELTDRHRLAKKSKVAAAHELGLYSCRLIRNGKTFSALPLLLTATYRLNLNMYYVRSAGYWLWRSLGRSTHGAAKYE